MRIEVTILRKGQLAGQGDVKALSVEAMAANDVGRSANSARSSAFFKEAIAYSPFYRKSH